MAVFRSVSVTRSYEQVVDQLLDRIRAGDFLPGSRLPTERELGELFGVSRGVIREAIKVLITLGAVESRQGSGTYVASDFGPMVSRALVLTARPDASSLQELMEMRMPLECFGAHLAAERATPEQRAAIAKAATESGHAANHLDWEVFGVADNRFHVAIYAATANSFLITVMNAMREIQQNAVAMASLVPGSMAAAAEQHLAIASAITVGDAALAEEAMRIHVAYSSEELISTLAKLTRRKVRANRNDNGDNAPAPRSTELTAHQTDRD